MIAIVDGDLYQWDTGRYISLDDDYDWVDFKVRGVDECLRVESPGETVQIPNVTLTNSGRLIVYLGSIDDDGSQTVVTSEFCIIARPKPFGYQADADDHLNWEKITEIVVSKAEDAVQDKYDDDIAPVIASNVELAKGYKESAQESAQIASAKQALAASNAAAAYDYFDDAVKEAERAKGYANRTEINSRTAYEIAVKNGFVGTEQQWLTSLKGDKGAKGDKGDQGDDYVLTDDDKSEIAALVPEKICIIDYGDTDAYDKIDSASKAGKTIVCRHDSGISGSAYATYAILAYYMHEECDMHAGFTNISGIGYDYAVIKFYDFVKYEDDEDGIWSQKTERTPLIANGKGLSSNDYTDADKAKVAAIPTKTSQLTNDSGYLTEHQSLASKADVVHSHVVEDITDMPSIPQSADDIAYGESNVADELGSIRQDIANVLPNIERSKNLFYIHPDVIGKEYNGVTVSKDENGLYSLSGTADGSANIPLITDSITKYALPAGTYTFTVYWVKKPAFFTIKYAYGVGQRGTTILSHSSGSSEYSSATVNLERDAIVYIMINSGKNAAGKFYAQIESSSQMTEYAAPSGIADYKSRAKLTSLSSFGAYPAVLHEKAVRCNAGCFKGDVYQWIVSTNYNLHWVNIITGENGYQKYSNSGLNYDNSYHANDMCYSPVDDCFYISSMLSSGAIAKLTTGYVYDGAVYPKDGDGNVVITSGIAFNRITNEYILAGDDRYIRGENDQNHTIETSGNNWNFYVYDHNWNYLRTIVPTDTARQTKQGIETDGYYIYRIITDSDYRAYMRTYLLDGTYISETEIAELKGTELEDISYDWEHGYFVCNVNVHGEGNKTRIYNIIPDMNPKHAIGATQLMIRRMLA